MENKICGILTAYRSDLSHKEIKLGIKYNQDSIIVIDKQNGAYFIGAYVNDKNLPKNSELFIGKFTPSKIADVYTQLGKDSFIFESKEIESYSDGYLNKLFEEDKIEQNDSYDILAEKLLKRYNRLCKNISDFVIDTLFK